MFLVGLTGGIATGKTTVANIFTQLGCPIVDADKIAREVVEPGRPAWKKIRLHFGDSVFLEDGRLHREELGRIIFGDAKKRRLLNSITHPEIYKTMAWQILTCFLKGEQFVVMDIPLLYETRNVLPYLSFVMVVSCDADAQLDRLRERNDLSTEDALQRINAQMPLAEKCAAADYVIDNSGDMEQTRQTVERIYLTLRSSKQHWRIRALLISVVAGSALLGAWLVRRIGNWGLTT